MPYDETKKQEFRTKAEAVAAEVAEYAARAFGTKHRYFAPVVAVARVKADAQLERLRSTHIEAHVEIVALIANLLCVWADADGDLNNDWTPSDALKETVHMLCAKNEAYGDSVINPVRVFSRANPSEQIRVRLDDKLSRIARGKGGDEDVLLDLIGYLFLLRMVETPAAKVTGNEGRCLAQESGEECNEPTTSCDPCKFLVSVQEEERREQAVERATVAICGARDRGGPDLPTNGTACERCGQPFYWEGDQMRTVCPKCLLAALGQTKTCTDCGQPVVVTDPEPNLVVADVAVCTACCNKRKRCYGCPNKGKPYNTCPQ